MSYQKGTEKRQQILQKQIYKKRKLIKQEQQAYQGAKMFYFGILPLSFIGLIFFSSYLYQIRLIYNNNEQQKQKENNQQFILLVYYIIGSILTYLFAAYYYTKCNNIQTTPNGKKKQLLYLLIEKSQSQHNLNNQLIQNKITERSIFISEQDTSQLNHYQQNYSNNINNNSQLINKPKKHYCSYCKIQCQYRTKHCKKCQICIQRYDHHCFWIGNCVGRHNHRSFYIFLIFQSFNNFLQLKAFLIIRSISIQNHFQFHFIIWLIIYSLTLLSFGFLCFTGWLTIYHTMLITVGSTTWEQMRRDKINYLKYLPTGYNPFSKGFKQNFITFFTEQTRENSQFCEMQEWDTFLPTYEEAKILKPGFNFIENQYYSCC